MTTTHHLSAA